MRGHLRQRQRGVWELVVDLGRDPLTHRRRQLSRSLRGTKREAERELAALVGDVSDGRETNSNATLADVLARWLDLAADNLSPTTLDEYKRLVANRIEPTLGAVPVRRLTTRRLDAFYQALAREAGLAPASIRQVHAVIRRGLGQAVKWGWIRSNPAADASPPRLRRRELAPPAPADLRKLLAEAEAEDRDFAVFLRLMATTGLRRGEACGLRWTDVDVEAEALVVQRAIVVVHGEGLFEKDTKTHASRRIALDHVTIEALRGHRGVMRERAAACGVDLGDDAFVFSHAPDGSRPWRPENATSTFTRVRGQAGLQHVRLHDLRHMHATQLLAAGVPVRTVSGRLGHANAATTLNVYGHFLEASDREAAAVMGELLDE